jgi:predicted nucleotidyltransferase
MGIQGYPYDPYADPVIQALIAEAQADPDAIGLVLTGSRALGEATDESDYDVIFVVTDEAIARYEQAGRQPVRGASIAPPIDTEDIWSDSSGSLQLGKQVDWMLPAYAESLVLYDRTGETARVIDAIRRMPEERAREEASRCYDGYLNALYRSLKCWRRGNRLGGRLEAADSIGGLLSTLFALERRWTPYRSRLHHHLHHLEGQGWADGELQTFLLDLAGTGDPRRQQELAHRVVALLSDRGHHAVYEDWGGKIDTALAWEFE